MSRCIQCGQELVGGAVHCSYHVGAMDESWATANRMVCDFFHRGIEPLIVPGEVMDRLTLERLYG